MADGNQYKIKIDKDILTNFLLDTGKPNKAQYDEVVKVFTVVLIKHFSKYLSQKDDLFSYAWIGVLSKRKNYDQSFSSYNYIYTISRNEIGNATKRYGREDATDEILPISNGSITPAAPIDFELPLELKKFKKYLTGEVDFTTLDLTPVEAFHLITFTLANVPFRTKKIPEFISEKGNALDIVYKAINLMLT